MQFVKGVGVRLYDPNFQLLPGSKWQWVLAERRFFQLTTDAPPPPARVLFPPTSCPADFSPHFLPGRFFTPTSCPAAFSLPQPAQLHFSLHTLCTPPPPPPQSHPSLFFSARANYPPVFPLPRAAVPPVFFLPEPPIAPVFFLPELPIALVYFFPL